MMLPYCARNACLIVTPPYASSGAIAKEDICKSEGVKSLCEKIWA